MTSFIGRFRDERLSQHWFGSRAKAARIMQAWRQRYNRERPHSALGLDQGPPRRRSLDATMLAVAGCGLLVGYPVLGLDGSVWSVVVLAALLVPTLIVAWPLGALAPARPAPPSPRDPERQRMPESRSASA